MDSSICRKRKTTKTVPIDMQDTDKNGVPNNDLFSSDTRDNRIKDDDSCRKKRRVQKRRPRLMNIKLDVPFDITGGGSNATSPGMGIYSRQNTEILENSLHVGSSVDAHDLDFLKENEITAIVSLGSKLPEPIIQRFGATNYLHINISDSSQENILQHFPRVNKFIDSHQTTLLHCMAGISRSSTCAIAYIMSKQSLSCREAYEFVQKRRPIIGPNFSFIGQLETYGKRLEAADQSRIISLQRKNWNTDRSLSFSILDDYRGKEPSTALPSPNNQTRPLTLQRQSVSCIAEITNSRCDENSMSSGFDEDEILNFNIPTTISAGLAIDFKEQQESHTAV